MEGWSIMEIQLERERILNAQYRRAQKQKGYRKLRLERMLQREMIATTNLGEMN
jgi:hypothetical protein